MEISEPKPPGTLWATPALLRGSYTFTLVRKNIPVNKKIYEGDDRQG
jgi:hypothetical protein